MDHLKAKGWLTDAERELLKSLAEDVPENGIIINIGVEYGASLHCFRAGNPTAELVGIDIIGDDKLVGDPRAVILRDHSAEILPLWRRKEKIPDLIFVDGGHSYITVMEDTEYGKLLPPGGVIAFHDCYEWPPALPRVVRKVCPGVNEAVDKWYDPDGWIEHDPVDSIRYFRKK